MSDEAKFSHGVMEGEGAYNRYAKLPAGGVALALPLLEKAAQGVRLDPEDQPFVLADYGSSQGKNSLAPLRVAIMALRSRLDRPIFTYHIDQPSNDFNSLFEVLDADPDRYTLDRPHIFPAAIGRSFYSQVLPAEERARMVLGSYPRRQSELFAPFARDGKFLQLVVQDCQFSVLEDAAWADYQQDGNKEALASKHALFFRSIFIPSLASALEHAGDAEARRAFGDQLENGLKSRLLRQPAALHSFVQTLVLAKQ
jgi:hypothetical protein